MNWKRFHVNFSKRYIFRLQLKITQPLNWLPSISSIRVYICVLWISLTCFQTWLALGNINPTEKQEKYIHRCTIVFLRARIFDKRVDFLRPFEYRPLRPFHRFKVLFCDRSRLKRCEADWKFPRRLTHRWQKRVKVIRIANDNVHFFDFLNEIVRGTWDR